MFRCVAIAAVDGFVGWMIYLSSTNRAFLNPPSTAERIERSIKIVESMRNKMNSVSVLRNTINRDEELRGRSQAYWIQEGRVMSDAMEDREVIEGVQNALEGRIDMAGIARDADSYASSVIDLHSRSEIS